MARDLERTLGLPISTKGYYIISNYTAFANSLAKGKKNVLLVKSTELLDTRELLVHPKVVKFINTVIARPTKSGEAIPKNYGVVSSPPKADPRNDGGILVFKNTTQIEKICVQNGWPLLNPNAELASKVEEKITQVEWLNELKKYLPPFEIKIAKEIKWTGEPFILQFNRAHTGSGTILVESAKQLEEIQAKFPLREVRVTKYIQGSMFTNNNVVWGKKILCGNISYQITGLKPFTNMPFATVGNDWALPYKILLAQQKKEYLAMAKSIGEKLAQSGWKGLFGIDVVLDEKSGKLFLIEINARQPASTSFESQLQQNAITNNKNCHFDRAKRAEKSLTTFQAHLLSLLEEKETKTNLIKIKSGAQITQKIVSLKKVIKLNKLLEKIKVLKKNNFQIFLYNNDKPESDWVRIQSKSSVADAPNSLNKHGEIMQSFSFSLLK